MLELTGREARNCLVVVEQKGDDPVECRERVEAGCALFDVVAATAVACRFMVVGGAGGDIAPRTVRQWCSGSAADPVIANASHHTRDKGDAIAAFVVEHKVTAVLQVTSLYHSLRAYLTTTAALRAAGAEAALLNHVSDTTDPAAIGFALLDEIFLAKEIDPRVGFDPQSEDYDTYRAYARSLTREHGLDKFLAKRYGEARRITAYAEYGTGDLVTDLSIKEILGSYPVL